MRSEDAKAATPAPDVLPSAQAFRAAQLKEDGKGNLFALFPALLVTVLREWAALELRDPIRTPHARCTPSCGCYPDPLHYRAAGEKSLAGSEVKRVGFVPSAFIT